MRRTLTTSRVECLHNSVLRTSSYRFTATVVFPILLLQIGFPTRGYRIKGYQSYSKRWQWHASDHAIQEVNTLLYPIIVYEMLPQSLHTVEKRHASSISFPNNDTISTSAKLEPSPMAISIAMKVRWSAFEIMECKLNVKGIAILHEGESVSLNRLERNWTSWRSRSYCQVMVADLGSGPS